MWERGDMEKGDVAKGEMATFRYLSTWNIKPETRNIVTYRPPTPNP